MKKLIIVLVGIIVSVGGCGPSFCDSNSPDYDPQRCQAFMQQMNQWGQEQKMRIDMQTQMQMHQLSTHSYGY